MIEAGDVILFSFPSLVGSALVRSIFAWGIWAHKPHGIRALQHLQKAESVLIV
jgi:hypothetical protein